MSKYLTSNQLAERWGLNPVTLSNWRTQGRGPKFLKIGGKILYPKELIEAAESKLASSTAESRVLKNDPGVTQRKRT